MKPLMKAAVSKATNTVATSNGNQILLHNVYVPTIKSWYEKAKDLSTTNPKKYTFKAVKALLLEALAEFYPFSWHTSKNKSEYIKFRNSKLGSIRIADHKSRDKYSYKYDINIEPDNQIDIPDIIQEVYKAVKETALNKHLMDKELSEYVVWANSKDEYITVGTQQEYEYYVFKKDVK